MSPEPTSEEWVNPRVTRTRDRVLTVARRILLERGPVGLTYSHLAQQAEVTRQTLYRHWPDREALLADVILSGPDVGYPKPGDRPREVIIEFLTSLRAGLSDPPTATALLAVAAQAHHDPGSAAALAAIVADRRAALNTLLAPGSLSVGVQDYAILTGPVIFQLLVARGPVTDELLHAVVDGWLAARSAAGGKP